MKTLVYTLSFLLIGLISKAQQTGDTIFVKSFKYGSNTRDTLINFPSGNLTFEKIILKYNMRCKNALISTQSLPNQGCGEWDYSCNTYIVDSSKIENALNTTPNYVISNFTGTVFPYTSQPLYDYYNFSQTNVTLNNIISETQYSIGLGTTAASNVLKSNEKSGRTQIFYTAAELSAAGLTAGNIDGLLLNVANVGGGVNFLKIGIQSSTLSNLSASMVTVSGFTNYFNSNFTFTNGINRIQFPSTPFVWNGTSNIIIDLSFTNTNPTNPIVFNGSNANGILSLYANNNYALDLSALGHVLLNAPTLSLVTNELTVAFWAYGHPNLIPTNTSMLYGYGANNNQRNFNLHLPWSNSNMYFDCGFSNGGYDRINKVATTNEMSGQWNHWAFTKNSNSGVMKIYLNGSLWHSGTGLTKAMSIMTMILGKDNNLQNNWKGKVNELNIWNKELAQSDIQTWMNKMIDNTHPFYSNLVAYYKLNEGSGQSILDSKNNITSTGVNLQWTYDRGNNLFKSFSESNIRPNIIFLRGNYSLTVASQNVKDSVMRNPSVVQQYSITSNATVVPIINDAVVLVSTNNLYQALPLNVYNGDTGVLTSTIAVNTQSSLTISNLNYYKRFPFYNEIMSFVTPYGKGLDLGVKGKTWYYDVTDFSPILTGPKRMLMTLGGENQEQMDLDFWFIVGTPPRNVLQFNQLWQGAARDGGASIGSITNDTRFTNLSVPVLSNGQAFKLRSTITGHGAQGEFSQNGGLINHYFNLNGGPNEFAWQITEGCASNPITAQGGTWVYDRQGWCPGQASLTKEFNLTSYLTAGTSVSMDYNCSNPSNPSGDYRYIVANQFVTYGAANFSNDAAIIDVLAPSNKVLYSKTNPICANPVVLIQNTGASTLTTLTIDYWLNNSTTKQTYTWTGSLSFMDTTRIYLPIGALWQSGVQNSNNFFNVQIKTANNTADMYQYNNSYASAFDMAASIAIPFTIEFKTNNYPSENTYLVLDDAGNPIAGPSPLVSSNTTYSDNYEMYGCYKLVVEDIGGNGLTWWASTAQGSGFVRIKDAAGNIIKTFSSDFGNHFEYSFTTYDPLSINKYDLENKINVYPNPAKNLFTVQGNNLEKATIKLTDILGRDVQINTTNLNDKIVFDSSDLKTGVYFIQISQENTKVIKKIVIN